MEKLKICPDLTAYETKESILVGYGTYTRPVVHECIKEKCVAFGEPYWCFKYKNSVIYDDVKE